ncbi:Lrp/AsnC family transcriptional regulator [Lentibacter sp. XHP0401]|jgi:DNA-binding Lrp family transcriptional regulator|uniref:Lrp/AsnC family transcriptional regulator n=1 Tax=Lentibacter sp. XHP0401 TaxID=2984334 RepID=UPI0021E834DD|nr:Lrp/AsnC family transcriptional regulator [Lentibacter sp. XHP0401]MCV2893357.1 Lrp/AsnC family transcriptional regulator [Lentibacter sp. XHP0401]
MRDQIDSKLITALQENAQLTSQELAERLGLSASQAARRRQKLEASGVIRGYRAELDAAELGLGVQAFVQVQLLNHDRKITQSFNKLMVSQPEIVSAWAMTGDADLLLRIYSKDLASLNALIHDILLAHGAVSRVHSQIVMNQIKQDAPLPA